MDELIARSDEVHARYCAPDLADALSGASVSVSRTPEHEAGAIRVLDEQEPRAGQVVIRTAEGTDFVSLRKYVLERDGGEWWITSQTDLGIRDSWVARDIAIRSAPDTPRPLNALVSPAFAAHLPRHLVPISPG